MAILILLIIPFNDVFAHEQAIKNMVIHHPYLLKEDSNRAYGFLSVENRGLKSDYLLKVISKFSLNSRVLTQSSNSKTLSIFDLSGGLEIPAGDALHFGDDDLILLFTNLDKKLEWLDLHSAIFFFKNAGIIELEFEVEE